MLGRLDARLRGTRELLELADALAARAVGALPQLGLVRGGALVVDRGVQAVDLGAGLVDVGLGTTGILGRGLRGSRCAPLLVGARTLPSGLGQREMHLRVPVAVRGNRLDALGEAASALLRRGGALARPGAVLAVDLGQRLVRGSLLVTALRLQLGHLGERLLRAMALAIGAGRGELVRGGAVLRRPRALLLRRGAAAQRLAELRREVLLVLLVLFALLLGVLHGQRLRDVLEIGLLGLDAEEQLGHAAGGHRPRADEERDRELAALAGPDHVPEDERARDAADRSADRVEERDRERPRLHREDLARPSGMRRWRPRTRGRR